MENFRYLCHIIKALNKLYNNDYQLLSKLEKTYRNCKPHEQTITFRIALYLAQEMEQEKNFYIDCEYHGNGKNRKTITDDGQVKKIRPDIIFHDRGEQNIFCIEVKKQSMRQDGEKIKSYIKEYKYQEGYCIYNIRAQSICLMAFRKNSNFDDIQNITYKLKYENKILK